LPRERLLGSSVLTVGFIAGIAEATANITKIFSGALSDWLAQRKLLAAIGYSFAACTKPVFPRATPVGWEIAARFIETHWKRYPGRARPACCYALSHVHFSTLSHLVGGAVSNSCRACGLLVVSAADPDYRIGLQRRHGAGGLFVRDIRSGDDSRHAGVFALSIAASATNIDSAMLRASPPPGVDLES
jgi:hypothetical protein